MHLKSENIGLIFFFHSSFKRGSMQEYGILPHSRTYYCLLLSLYFFFFFYSHLTPHSPTGMAGGSPRLTNTSAPTTTAAS